MHWTCPSARTDDSDYQFPVFPTTHSACSSIAGVGHREVSDNLYPSCLHQHRQLCKEHSSKQPAVLATLLQQPRLLPQPHKRVPAAVANLAGQHCTAALAILWLSAVRFMTAPSFMLVQSKHFPEHHQELTESSDSDWRHSSRRKNKLKNTI